MRHHHHLHDPHARHQEQMQQLVRFKAGGASIAGTFFGAVIAICVPLVLLKYGQALESGMLTILVAIGVGMGCLITIASAFFGIVLPAQVGGEGGCHCGCKGGHAEESASPPAQEG